MKKFILNIIVFWVIVGVIISVICGLNVVVTRNFSYKIPDFKKVLVIGDSHTELGIDTSIAPEIYNSSNSGDSAICQYLRTMRILEANPQIKCVMISVSPISIGDHVDLDVFREQYLVKRIPDYFSLWGPNEFKIFLSQNSSFFFKTIATKPVQMLQNVFGGNAYYLKQLGTERRSYWETLDEDLRNGPKQRFSEWDNPNFGNDISLTYFKKLAVAINDRNVKVILISMPIYQADKWFDMEKFYTNLKEVFPNCELWDYTNWECPDNFRQNVDHLNWNGSNKITPEIRERLDKEGYLK